MSLPSSESSRPSPEDSAGRTFAVIVAYEPDLELLGSAVDAVQAQVDRLLIFDNASASPALHRYYDSLVEGVDIQRSAENVGIAAAINVAITKARAAGFDQLLILDQDSVIGEGLVTILTHALREHAGGTRVAAVGPQFYDVRTGHVAPFITVGFPMSRKLFGGPGQVVECDFLISSGSLLSLDAVASVGGMDESLFIDNVDLEWSFRARHRGYKLFGVCDARMAHQIGEHVDIPVLGKQTVHSTTRLYYIMRNRVLLYRRRETPRVWIAQDVPRVLLKFLKMSLFVSPRGAYTKAMLGGLRDGIRGRAGRIGG
ncbi:glycosyltransferase family 2 protein [Mycetocola sp.]|uniref:glycosyltransferase family 2 protein n=1 Tax=Mycetocola sp. TaxID=1871042 RepID=UPI00398A2C80